MRNKLVASVVGIIGLLLAGYIGLGGVIWTLSLLPYGTAVPLHEWIIGLAFIGMGGFLVVAGIHAWTGPDKVVEILGCATIPGFLLWFYTGNLTLLVWSLIIVAYALLSLLNRPKAVQVAIAPIDVATGLEMRAEST